MNRGSPRIKGVYCPYKDCRGAHSQESGDGGSPESRHILRKGYYYRKNDSKRITRYRCGLCKRSFSSARFGKCFGQKKRTVNGALLFMTCSSMSQNRIALILKINRKTVVRKFLFLAEIAKEVRQAEIQECVDKGVKFQELNFDEMQSYERSKCLPLSIPLMVEKKERKILGFRVASMPANGPLAEISRKKYGKREDQRAEATRSLFEELAPIISPQAEITTDQNPHYPGWIKRHFPKAKHKTTKGRPGRWGGFGELKKIGFDPLFASNHSAAMFRANINRLARKTWATTKRADRLAAHIELYIFFHNQILTEKGSLSDFAV